MLMEGFDYSKLVADKRTYYSVIKNIEVVGEAAYMLTKAFKREHPSTPWKFVQGMLTFWCMTMPLLTTRNYITQLLMTFPSSAVRWRNILPRPIGRFGNQPPTILTLTRIWSK